MSSNTTVATDVALASTASSQTLLEANAARTGLILENTDANAAYILYGTTATTAKFTKKIATNESWTMPYPPYQGRIDVIWAANGSGSLIGSELSQLIS